MYNIAIYGISGSGKTYLSEYLSKNDSGFYFFAGSEFLIKQSEHEKLPFAQLSDKKKTFYRHKYIEECKILPKKLNKHIITDAHYSFYKNGEFEISFLDIEQTAYDFYLYLDTDSTLIQERLLQRQKERKKEYTIEEIEEWKEFEKKELKQILNKYNKELVIIDSSDIDQITTFIRDYTALPIYNDPTLQISTFIKKNIDTINQYNNIILVDCDKTLSYRDMTTLIYKDLGLDFNVLRYIFRNNNYTSFSFYLFSQYCSSIPYDTFQEAAHSIMNSNLNLFSPLWNELQNEKYLVIGVTAGIYEVWNEIFKSNMESILLLGGIHKDNQEYVVTQHFKGLLCSILRNTYNKNIIAIGDSLIDYDMLIEADNSFLVAHTKLNNSLLKKELSSISQLSYQDLKYPNLVIKDSIYE